MDEEFEQELYEEPDYNVWETNRVYEGMAIERAEAEAEAEREALFPLILAAVEHREWDADRPIWGDVVKEITDALVAAGVKAPEPKAEAYSIYSDKWDTLGE